jgi:hypothetical protein
MRLLSAPSRRPLDAHPAKTDCARVLENAFLLNQERAKFVVRDLPFGIALTTTDHIQLIGFRGGSFEAGRIEVVQARLWSLRPVLRACALCTLVEVKRPGGAFDALRVQVEHASGPPLDVYQPVEDIESWWVEPGTPFVFRPVGW